MKTIQILILTMFGLHLMAADMYNAYLSGYSTIWKQAIEAAKQSYIHTPDSESKFQWALAEFGLLNANMADPDEELFNTYVKSCEEKLNELIKSGYRTGDAKALLSALAGFKIAFSPWKGMILGPKATQLVDEALEEAPQSPIVWYLYGNNQLFTPEMWGGSIANAVQAYKKSITLFELQNHSDSWLYLEVHAWLGQALVTNKQFEEALIVYEKALEAEPDFRWVSENLLPSLKNKMQ